MIQKKVCLLGSSGVGKTSLISQFVEGIFSDKYLTTIGVKIDKKTILTPSDELQLMLWDIEGTDRYNTFQARYLRGAAACIIVVDQTRSSSLIEGMDILALSRDVIQCPHILAINKVDISKKWHWSDEQVKEYSSLFDLSFYTSAKTGQNVDELFNDLANILVNGSPVL